MASYHNLFRYIKVVTYLRQRLFRLELRDLASIGP